MANLQWHKAKSILIFNNRKILVALTASLNETARITNLKPSNISNACSGKIMSCGRYYFRFIDDGVEIALSDVGTLKLEEYDKFCNKPRKVYANTKMNRKNWKYNKRNGKSTESNSTGNDDCTSNQQVQA